MTDYFNLCRRIANTQALPRFGSPQEGAEVGRMVVSENGAAIFTYDPARPVEAD